MAFQRSDRLIDKPIPMPFVFVEKKGAKMRSNLLHQSLYHNPHNRNEDVAQISLNPGIALGVKRGRICHRDQGFNAVH